MARRIDAEVAVKVTGKDDVDKLESQLDQLAGEKVEVPIGADTGTAGRDIDDLLSKVDKLSGEPANLLLTSNATQITNDIADLIIDIDKLDSSDPTIDAKIANVNALTGDLEKIQAKAREINQTPIVLDTGRAARGVDDISDSARGANSALANMIGNTAQDVGQLGGFAGSTGVAIGQMAEYAADATLAGEGLTSALKSMVLVAGPIAVLTTAFSVVNGVLGEMQAEAEATEARISGLAEAMAATDADATTMAAALAENSEALQNLGVDASTFGGLVQQYLGDIGKNLPIVGGLIKDSGVDVIDVLDRMGVSLLEFSQLGRLGTTGRNEFVTQMNAMVDAGKLTEKEYDALSQTIDQNNEALDRANQLRRLTLPMQIEQAQNEAKTAAATEAHTERMQEQAEAQRRVADGYANYVDVLRQFNTATETGAAAQDAFTTAWQQTGDAALGTTQILADLTEANQGFIDSLKDSEGNLNANAVALNFGTEEGRKSLDALEQLRDAYGTDLARALKDAGGNFDVVRQRAGFWRRELREQLSAVGVNEDQIRSYLRQLGLTPRQVQTEIRLTRAEEARQKVQLLQTAIDGLPRDVQTSVTQKIIKGDYVGALREIQSYYSGNPTSVDVNAEPGDVSSARNSIQDYYNRNPVGLPVIPRVPSGIGRFSSGGWASPGEVAMVGEHGPEMVVFGDRARVYSAADTRRSIISRTATAAPPVSVVANINLRTAVIGNRYDVARTVTAATKEAIRIGGQRAVLSGRY